MSEKKKAGKALPILTIVFSGVSLLLFLSKFSLNVVKLMLVDGYTASQAVWGDLSRTGVACFSAVLFILCASACLRRSPKTQNLMIATLLCQAVSCIVILIRQILLFSQAGTTNSRTYCFIALYALITVLCVAAIILCRKQKSAKAVIAVAAAAGMAVAAVYFASNVFQIVRYSSYYFNHRFILASTFLCALLYAAAMIFYYTAFLFMGLYKLPGKKENVKVVIKK